MELIRSAREQAEVRLTVDELHIINNALNEVCHGLDVPEFATRMGASLEQAKALLESVGLLLDDSKDSDL